MHAIWLEPVENASQGSGGRTRRMDASYSNIQEPNYKLDQAQFAIVELYQENR